MSSFNTNSSPSGASKMFRSDSAMSGNSSSRGSRVDANEVLFFTNELNFYDQKEYDVIKNELSWQDLFFTRTDIDAGANNYNYSMYDAFGESKYSANGAKDIQIVGATGKQFTSPFGNIDVAMQFTAQDLKASNMVRKNIITRLRTQAMRSNFEMMNKTCFEGYAPLGIPGLLSNEHITNKQSVAGANADAKAWGNKTADEIFKDIMDAYNDALAATGNNIRPNTLIMSMTSYNDIATRIFNTFNGQTVLQQVINMTGVRVKGLPELNKKFQGGTDGFIFFKNDPDFVEQLVPTYFETTDPQQEGWTFTVYCRSRYGGVIIRQPKMFVVRYDIGKALVNMFGNTKRKTSFVAKKESELEITESKDK